MHARDVPAVEKTATGGGVRRIGRRRQLAVQQAITALGIAFALGVVMTLVQLTLDWRQARQDIDATLNDVVSLVRRTAAEAAFNLDERAAATIVGGLLTHENIAAAELRDDMGKVLAGSRRTIEDDTPRWVARTLFGDRHEMLVALDHGDGRQLAVGALALTIDTRGVAATFSRRVMVQLATGAASAILLALALTFAFKHGVTDPLRRLSAAVARVNPQRPETMNLAIPEVERRNELGLLARNIVGFLNALRENLHQRESAEAALRRMATLDALTQLPNRSLLADRLRHAVLRASRTHRQVAVMFIDFDRFKLINDSLGHSAGDDFLRQVSGRLASCLRESDTLGRYGGDEFLVIAADMDEGLAAARIADRMRAALVEPVTIDGRPIYATMSIGIAVFPRDGRDPDGLLRAADTALYSVKASGRDNYCFYSSEMNEAATSRFNIEHGLRHALDHDELELHFQPKIASGSLRLTGVEALLRWRHPERGLIPPLEFIPVAEESGLMQLVGARVVRQACRFVRVWRDRFGYELSVAVNVSPAQLGGRGLIDVIRAETADHGISPSALQVEITESGMVQRLDEAQAMLEELRGMGVAIALDDFGTGYSSLSYLRRLPLSVLKIDRAFVTALPDDRYDSAVAATIVELAHRIGLKVVAEGVETEAQAEFLRAVGCDEMQGYLFGHPMPEDELVVLVAGLGPDGVARIARGAGDMFTG